jgi:hypothetical protein
MSAVFFGGNETVFWEFRINLAHVELDLGIVKMFRGLGGVDVRGAG